MRVNRQSVTRQYSRDTLSLEDFGSYSPEEELSIEDKLREMAIRLGLDSTLIVKRASQRRLSWPLCEVPGCMRTVVKYSLCSKHYNHARRLFTDYGGGYAFDQKYVDQVYVPIIKGIVEAEKLVGSGA